MLVVWESHVEFRDKTCGVVAETRKRATRCVERRCFDVAVGANLWAPSLPREELLTMAVQAGGVFGKLRNIRKRVVAFPNFLPVLCRKLVTCAACKFFFPDVSGVSKVGVISSDADHYEC